MACRIHRVEQHRSSIRGIAAMTLVSNHHFSRHSHDQFAIGVITFGAQRSWRGVGQVEASAGDVIMANPGEMHDGLPLDGKARGWRMIYFDPDLVSREIEEGLVGGIEVVRPVARDPQLAWHFSRLFASLAACYVDGLAQEEALIRSLFSILRRYGARRPSSTNGRSPSVEKVIQRLDAAPHEPVSLAELAALAGVSRFQLLRGFAREIGTTPPAYLVQRRVCLARQLLAAGETTAESALTAGFADQSHMTRAFLRYLGITTGRYRAAVA